ncbi:uncharacterized protein LOC142355768, partial [Convolutriloba macropyga]|uniref:uncharacterized protein LOC142355768 n=1 Tax=Convolutriloba macropyga TaxID=536237 RepID=UPI003F5227D7
TGTTGFHFTRLSSGQGDTLALTDRGQLKLFNAQYQTMWSSRPPVIGQAYMHKNTWTLCNVYPGRFQNLGTLILRKSTDDTSCATYEAPWGVSTYGVIGWTRLKNDSNCYMIKTNFDNGQFVDDPDSITCLKPVDSFGYGTTYCLRDWFIDGTKLDSSIVGERVEEHNRFSTVAECASVFPMGPSPWAYVLRKSDGACFHFTTYTHYLDKRIVADPDHELCFGRYKRCPSLTDHYKDVYGAFFVGAKAADVKYSYSLEAAHDNCPFAAQRDTPWLYGFQVDLNNYNECSPFGLTKIEADPNSTKGTCLLSELPFYYKCYP